MHKVSAWSNPFFFIQHPFQRNYWSLLLEMEIGSWITISKYILCTDVIKTWNNKLFVQLRMCHTYWVTITQGTHIPSNVTISDSKHNYFVLSEHFDISYRLIIKLHFSGSWQFWEENIFPQIIWIVSLIKTIILLFISSKVIYM